MARRTNLNRYALRLGALLKHPFFWILTISGNAIIVVGAFLLYHFESGGPGAPTDFLDSLLWSTGTVTTIGYGNYTPVTVEGKVTLLILMFAGTLFVWSYMGFLVTGLIAPELTTLERDVHEVEKEIHDLKVVGRDPESKI